MQKINYQRELEREIASFDGRVPTLLLHVCCAPCSSYVLKYLSEYFKITVLYYNPNIEPESEYRKRELEEKRFISECSFKNPVDILECDYNPDEFHGAVKGLENEPEGGKRCSECFKLRLKKTAQLCVSGGYDYFTTTLTISPLKDAERLNTIGIAAAEETGAKWLPSDFKKKEGYKQSIELSRQYNLYRQNYCGCIYSKIQTKTDSQ